MPSKFLDSRAHLRAGTRRPDRHPAGSKLSALVGLGVVMILSLPAQQVYAQEMARADISRGDQPTAEACPSWGEIHGLDPQGDGFLAVRTGPSTKHEQIDELHNGDVVMMCDYQNGWHGVVYPGEGQRAAECHTNSEQMPDPEAYRGPCKSGWVHGNWVRWTER